MTVLEGHKAAQAVVERSYNRRIVFGCERSPYTKGLEQELAKLQEAPENRSKSTALGMWLERRVEPQQPSAAEVITLMEPLPFGSTNLIV